MYSSKKRKKDKKLSTPKVPEQKLEKDISLSSLDDVNCKQYIGPLDRKYTERFQYTKSDKKEKMESIKKTQTSKKNEGLDKVSQIKMDTGIIEVGYDKDDKQIVFSFVKGRYLKERNRVIEERTKYKKVHASEKFKSVDDSFSGGSIEFKSNLYKSRAMLTKQFRKFSNDNDEDTTVDKVIPFKNTDYEEDQKEQVSEMKSESNTNRSEKHTAMSMLSNSKRVKDYKKMQLENDIETAVSRAREQIEHDSIINDDYIIYLKKKWLALQSSNEPIEHPNTDFNKDDNILEDIDNEAYTTIGFSRGVNIDNSETEEYKSGATGEDDSDDSGNSKNRKNFFERVIEEDSGGSNVKNSKENESDNSAKFNNSE